MGILKVLIVVHFTESGLDGTRLRGINEEEGQEIFVLRH